jgi:hypothetical protein
VGPDFSYFKKRRVRKRRVRKREGSERKREEMESGAAGWQRGEENRLRWLEKLAALVRFLLVLVR